MTEDIYRRLQKRLDHYSLGFPATESGVEIEILKELFSEEDATMFLHLTPKPETPEDVAQRMDRPLEAVAAQLNDMSERGLLFRLRKGDVVKYGAIPFVHGLFEFQVSRLDQRLAELVERYMDEGFHGAITRGAAAFLRPVPIQRTIKVLHNVAPYEDASEILRKANKVVVTDCICRKQKQLVGQGCDKPLEVCFMFGSMGQYYVDRGMGREVSADEAVRILTEAQEAGLVTQPATAQNPGGMCNCCGDCCGVLSSLKRHPKPAEMVFSNYFVVVDPDACTGCETCLDRCQMDAIHMNGDGSAQINRDRCIGCGLCVAACPEEALTLTSRPDHERLTPPLTGFEQMAFMAEKRKGA
ncbi:MAG: 4Fe-4S binding protein [Deltaproteobacteria bacterium]|nr:4Fe-4S binding protein [Deltaproteobacteria bacterium]